jgi:predicted Zn-dependent protease
VWLAQAEATGESRAVHTALEALAPIVAARERVSSETLSLYGRALLLNGDLTLARTALLRATTQFPIDGDAFLHLSQAEARLGRRDEARIALAKHRALSGP